MKYIIVWYEEGERQTKEFTELWKAERFAVDRSAEFAWALLEYKVRQEWHYKEYRHGVQVK